MSAEGEGVLMCEQNLTIIKTKIFVVLQDQWEVLGLA